MNENFQIKVFLSLKIFYRNSISIIVIFSDPVVLLVLIILIVLIYSSLYPCSLYIKTREMPIRPLPPSTSSLLRSSQSIIDPCSVIKELLDNALDALATCVKIEVSPNLLDLLQVRDDGEGVRKMDRAALGKRYWTSKAQRLQNSAQGEQGDEVSGCEGVDGASVATLGFRGEALANMAELSGGGLWITTRVEEDDGEVGVRMGFGRDGRMFRYDVVFILRMQRISGEESVL